jgi:hypothetical protein
LQRSDVKVASGRQRLVDLQARRGRGPYRAGDIAVCALERQKRRQSGQAARIVGGCVGSGSEAAGVRKNRKTKNRTALGAPTGVRRVRQGKVGGCRASNRQTRSVAADKREDYGLDDALSADAANSWKPEPKSGTAQCWSVLNCHTRCDHGLVGVGRRRPGRATFDGAVLIVVCVVMYYSQYSMKGNLVDIVT